MIHAQPTPPAVAAEFRPWQVAATPAAQPAPKATPEQQEILDAWNKIKPDRKNQLIQGLFLQPIEKAFKGFLDGGTIDFKELDTRIRDGIALAYTNWDQNHPQHPRPKDHEGVALQKVLELPSEYQPSEIQRARLEAQQTLEFYIKAILEKHKNQPPQTTTSPNDGISDTRKAELVKSLLIYPIASAIESKRTEALDQCSSPEALRAELMKDVHANFARLVYNPDGKHGNWTVLLGKNVAFPTVDEMKWFVEGEKIGVQLKEMSARGENPTPDQLKAWQPYLPILKQDKKIGEFVEQKFKECQPNKHSALPVDFKTAFGDYTDAARLFYGGLSL